ncbi:MAG: pyridoxamine 5'-phosphate oxidase family protein [Promethearchaeota archaeon]
MVNKLNEEQKDKILKILKEIRNCSLSTCSNGEPHTTLVQFSITSELKCIILSKNTRKKINNIKNNNNIWLTFDATDSSGMPKVIYIKGKAELEILNQRIFDEFLSYHGEMTRKIYEQLTAGGLEKFTRIFIKPEKVLTAGIFGNVVDTISFIV